MRKLKDGYSLLESYIKTGFFFGDYYWVFILPFKGSHCYEFQFGPVIVQWGGKLGRRVSVWLHRS